MKKLLSAFLAFAFVVISAHSFAGISSPVGLMGNAVLSPQIFSNGDGSLQDVLASTEFDLDATLESSYSGSGQDWSNLVPSPASGASQSDYKFFLGIDGTSDGSDPTFTGTAGNSAAYFAMDGTDHFRQQNANSQFLKDLAKTTGGQDWWAAITISLGSISVGQYIWAQGATATRGVHIQVTGGNLLRMRVRGDTSTVNVTLTPTFSLTTDTLLIISYDHATTTFRTWLNSTTGVDNSITPNTTTTDTSDVSDIGTTNGFSILSAGTKVYGYAMGNEFLDDTKATAICEALETRHNRDYDADGTIGTCTN